MTVRIRTALQNYFMESILSNRSLPHTEEDYIPYVFETLRNKKNRKASFAEIRASISRSFPLNRADKERLPSLGCPRWHQIVRNLKSNKTLLINYTGIREIPGGFALTR